MIILFIMLGLGVISLILFLISRDKLSSTKAVILKTLTSVLFILTAVASIIYVSYDEYFISFRELFPSMLIVTGLVFGAVGDITLDLKIYFKTLNIQLGLDKKDRDNMMWTGMVSFGIGHICYLAALTYQLENKMLLLWASLAGIALIALVMLISSKVLKFQYKQFFIPCTCYGFLLATFVLLSLFMLINSQTAYTITTFIGSLLFIISDLVLCMTYFSKDEDYLKAGFKNPESRLMIIINHITYYAAQFLIALSVYLYMIQ